MRTPSNKVLLYQDFHYHKTYTNRLKTLNQTIKYYTHSKIDNVINHLKNTNFFENNKVNNIKKID